MRKAIPVLMVFLFLTVATPALAAPQTSVTPTPTIEPVAAPQTSYAGGQATPSAAPVVINLVQPKENLTQPETGRKSPLEQVLDRQPPVKFQYYNFLQFAIRQAVTRGVPVNTLVLMILFPLIAAIIAAARHIVGVSGFGIFTPAVISVVFLATGVTMGVLLFVGILLIATLSRMILRKLRLPSLPRMALLLWFVSMGVLALMLISPSINVKSLTTISIFPIMLLILMAETFIEVQTTRTFSAAIQMTVETFVLALIAFLVVSTQALQEWVLLNPEIAVLLIAAADILIGRYSGLRLMEYWRFKELLKS